MKVNFEDFIKLKKTLQKDTPTKILSSSMEPYIYKDDIVKTSPIRLKDIKTGDPIVFWREDRLICHFMIKKIQKDDKTLLLTKGLNNRHFDPLLNSKYLLGVVVSPSIPYLKRKIFALYYAFYFLFKKN